MRGPLGGEAFHLESVPIKALEIRLVFWTESGIDGRLAYRLDLENLRLARRALRITSNYDDSIALFGKFQSNH